MSDTERPKISEMNKKKQAYEGFKQFCQQYIDSGGRSAELSDIIHGIMDKAYPPMAPKMVEQAKAIEEPTQVTREQSAILTTPKEAQPITIKHPHRITINLISSVVSSTIRQESIEPEPEEGGKSISISNTSTANQCDQ